MLCSSQANKSDPVSKAFLPLVKNAELSFQLIYYHKIQYILIAD